MWIEETKQGKYKFVERYTDPLTGKLKRASVTYSKNTASTKKLAIKELQEKIREKTKIVNANNITLKEICNYYLAAKEEELKRSSIDTARLCVSSLLRKLDGDLIVSRITALSIKEDLEGLTVSDVKRLKMVISWSYKQGYLLEPIHLKIPNKKSSIGADKGQELLYLEKIDLKEILDKLEKEANTYSQLVTRYLAEFLTLTGLRIGEALALEKGDIEDNILTVNKTLYKGQTGSPKTKTSYRSISINSRAIQIVKEVEMLKRINRINNPLLFPSCKGKYLSNKLISYNLKRIDDRLYPHLFRHTHASLLAEQGIALEMIQRRLGHARGEITLDIYIHITEKRKKEEVALFKELEIL